MVGESNQNVFLIQIDASNFAEFEISEFEISRFDCIQSDPAHQISCILFIFIMHISLPNLMFDHLLKSTNKWSNIRLCEENMQVVPIEVNFTHLICSPGTHNFTINCIYYYKLLQIITNRLQFKLGFMFILIYILHKLYTVKLSLITFIRVLPRMRFGNILP